MKKKLTVILLIVTCFTIAFAVNIFAATKTITSNDTGTFEGYDYEYWKDNGTGTMTLTGGSTFTCSWSNINNILFRTGKKLGSTKAWQDYGGISLNYTCNYQPNGNSYMAVYGWTKDPLVEYYIIDSYGTWKPPGNQVPLKGKITVDGRTYEVYANSRTGPSIVGDTTFQQYWSICTSKRTSGTITVSDHFKAWEGFGMKMGKMHEVSMVVEGYQSSGKAEMTKMDLTFGNVPSNNPSPSASNNSSPTPSSTTKISAFDTIEAENYNDTNSTTIETIGTGSGNGVGYIENGNTILFRNVDFGSGADSFKVRVAGSSNTNIELRLGSSTGTLIGTMSVSPTGDWDTYEEQTCSVNNATGVKDLCLVFSGPANVDWFTFEGGAPGPSESPSNQSELQRSDLNSDGVINMQDVVLLATKFSTISGDGKYVAKYDINNDGSINMLDVVIIAIYFNKTVTHTQSNTPTTKPTTKPSATASSNPNAKLLALTFDDGPDNTLTAKVLDKLDKYKVPATFMMIGQKVNGGTSSIIKRIVDSGHEIGNHSWAYDGMSGMSSSAIKDSISKTNAAIQQYAGVTPKFFRAPNLSYSQTLYDAVDLTFIQGITCNDWSSSTSAEQRANDIIAGAKDGTIILLHDVQPLPHPTPEALDILIPKLQSQGYEFVTLSELFSRKGVTLRANDNVAHTTLPN